MCGRGDNMTVTIRDIAKEAKVSPSTVSRVVNDSPLISQETKEKVRAIMKELNFTPNSIGKQLAKQSSFNIGFLFSTQSKEVLLDTFFYDIIRGVQSVVFANDYDLTICDLNYLKSKQSFLERFVYSKKIDGVILHVSLVSPEVINSLEELGFPYVIVGQTEAETTWVDIDNSMGGELAVTHLLDKGYKKISFISGTQDESISNHRLEGYKRTLKNKHIKLNKDYIVVGEGTEEDGYNHMQELLALENPPDAVICINNYTAIGALRAIQEKSLSIPQDIGVLTFDNFPLAPYVNPPLTCIQVDTFELGHVASELLMKKVTSNFQENENKVLFPKLIPRKSTEKQLRI